MTATPPTVWSAPVRFAEADQQGVVFNAHYLTYCDEAMGAFCEQRDLQRFASSVRLVTSTLTWSGPAHWGETIEVEARCAKVGRTSATMAFTVRTDGRDCCQVQTVYVRVDPAGAPEAIDETSRAALTA